MATTETHDGWSWRLGRAFGIDIRVHATFLLLLAWIALTRLLLHEGWGSAGGGVLYVIAVFGIVVVHELAHALTARRFGIATREILLLPIGGVSRMERMPSRPSEELLVAIAGPLTNVALALVLFVVLVATGTAAEAFGTSILGGSLVARLMWTNVVLAVFNLIPAFPMDGGRVLRSVLALRVDRARATEIAAGVGQIAAVGFALLGMFTNPVLVFIGVFVWFGAQEEGRMAQVHGLLAGISVDRAMVRRVMMVAPDDPVSNAMACMVAGFQEDLPVVDQGRLVGLISRDDALAACEAGKARVPVSSVMTTDVPTVSETDTLEAALDRLRETGRRMIAVVRGDVLVGLLPIQNVAYVLRMRQQQRLAHAHR